MSQENVEAVRRADKAWNTDDFDGFMADADPEVEVHPAIEPALEGGETTYRGFDVRESPGTTITAGLGNVPGLIFTRFATSASRSWTSLIST